MTNDQFHFSDELLMERLAAQAAARNVSLAPSSGSRRTPSSCSAEAEQNEPT